MSKWVWKVWREEFGAYFLVSLMVDFLFQTMSFFVVGFWWWVSLFWWWVSLTVDFRQWVLMSGFFVWRVFIGVRIGWMFLIFAKPFFLLSHFLLVLYVFFLFFFWEERDIKGEEKYIYLSMFFNRGGLRKINGANLSG